MMGDELPPDRDLVDQLAAEAISAEIIHLRDRLGLTNGGSSDLGPLPNVATMRASILTRVDIQPRDYLLSNLLGTTMRWLVVGDTGVGKTLFGVDLATAIATGSDFLAWTTRRPGAVAYFDGELPFETIRERLLAAEKLFGPAPDLTVYTRDVLAQDGIEMPPFDTDAGQAWLWRELERQHYDLVVFDNIGSLTQGLMVDEEAWRKVAPLVTRISSIRTGQIWLHHTGHDAGHSYGTKTREWAMDAVIKLSRADPDDPDNRDIKLEFTKTRHQTPETAALFNPLTLHRNNGGWICNTAPKGRPSDVKGVVARKRTWFLEALDELSEGLPLSTGHAGDPVQKVKLEWVRELMRKRGHLESEEGKVTPTGRKNFQRAREDLIAARSIASDGDLVWRIG